MTPAEFFKSLHNKATYSDLKVPGSASYFLRTTWPEVIAWCKGLPYPWAIELFRVNPDGSLDLLSEAEMNIEDQTPRKYRSFWENEYRVGVQWAPGKDVRFSIVRTGWDEPGDTEVGGFETRTITRQTETDYIRTDIMARGTKDEYSETYVFGKNGLKEWTLTTPAGTSTKKSFDVIRPAISKPIRLYGVLPEGRVAWIWSEGGEPTIILREERRPTLFKTQPEILIKKKKSIVQKIVDWFRWLFRGLQ